MARARLLTKEGIDTMKFFNNEQEALEYLKSELIDTLRDDLENQESKERAHYTDQDRQEMRDIVTDLKSILDRVQLV